MTPGMTGSLGAGRVVFPAGATSTNSDVRGLLAFAGEGSTAEEVLLFVDDTPFHPVDPYWPDQPDDRGWVEVAGRRLPVTRTLTVAAVGDGPPVVGNLIAFPRSTQDAAFAVGHLVHDPTGQLRPGDPVRLEVDQHRRRTLSRVHTACHLSAFALNLATNTLWKRAGARDTLGHGDFDKVACTGSTHQLDGTSVDTYRLGKSLRRLFAADVLVGQLGGYMAAVNEIVNDWTTRDAEVLIHTAGDRLSDRRTWTCALPQGLAEMACGGTHVSRTSQVGPITVTGSASADSTELVVTTSVGEPPAVRRP